jgi:DNA repair protein RecN (Recombination protein N)
MLKYLSISNVAIIDKVEVEFRQGFNALTGETGAGKSILIGALDLLLGSKASADIIRTGEEEACVEGLFELSEGDPIELAGEIGFAIDRENELILSRKFSRNGRSKCAINGHFSTLSMLQTLGESLVSIFGQHEHRTLLDSEEHIEILDRFGNLAQLRNSVSDAFSAWKKAAKDLVSAEKRLAEIQRRVEETAAEVEELTAAELKDAEEDELVQEREILRKASQIREKAYEAYQTLYSRSGSLMEGLTEVRKAIDFLAAANPKMSKLHENFEDAVYRLEDAALELRHVSETSHSDPARLERIEDRLALIRRLKKKYGKDLPGLIAHLDNLQVESGDILDARSAVKNLSALTNNSRQGYEAAAKSLSESRRAVASELETAIKQELQELAMPHAEFLVKFSDLGLEQGSATGAEKVEFLLASNPGEEPRPLARIASGGELSRIMLALKALQVDTRTSSTVIFDEVDAGIGGHTAVAVGSRLARVAQRQQVLCVTHLHQIAALADHHLAVTKLVDGGRTHIEVKALDPDDRVEELTRMLGASPSSEAVRDHVKHLMRQPAAEVS